jgi:short-subunit dehydrogenase
MAPRIPSVAVVTGASSGIGLAVANQLASDGFTVVGTSRSARSATASGVNYVALDVTDDESIRLGIDSVIDRFGRIDVLINNAGVGLAGAAEETSRKQAAAIFDTNVLGVAGVTNAVLPFMRKQGAGRIINISSIFGYNPAPNLAMYAASKYALEGYSESLDHEVRHLGIRVVVVEPGITTSNFDANIVVADRPLATYDAARATAAKTYEKNLRTADDPQIVVDTVLRAIRDRSPKSRYPAGKVARQLALAHRFAPAAAYNRLIRSANGLPAVPGR